MAKNEPGPDGTVDAKKEEVAKTKYPVKEQLFHDGKFYSIGEEIELTAEEAKKLKPCIGK
jgi:hypothetical protein